MDMRNIKEKERGLKGMLKEGKKLTKVEQRWSDPKPVTGVDQVFGGNIEELLPPRKDIPEEFSKLGSNNKWVKLANDLYYEGSKIKKYECTCRGDMDPNEAIKHIRAIMVSYRPKHEHKIAGCAWLLSLFFEDLRWIKEEEK